MRNITKILLVAIIAFVVYLVLPRTPNFKNFDPGTLASLEVQNWTAEKEGKGLGAVMARYKIYTSQYHFSPIAAYQIAQSQSEALKIFAASRGAGASPTDESRTLRALDEKYTKIRQQTKGEFDADALAREEYSLWIFEAEGNASLEETAGPITRILATFYGGAPEDFAEVGADLVTARAAIFKGAVEEGADPKAAAQTTARDAYMLLKEIADAPQSAAPQAEQ